MLSPVSFRRVDVITIYRDTPLVKISGLRRPDGAGSTIAPREGAARHALFPTRGRRRRAASAQARPVPACARHRDPRARPRRSEVDPPRRRAPRPDAGVGAPGALPRAEGTQAGRGAVRQDRAAAPRHPGPACVPPPARPRRERELEPDRDPGCDPDRASRGDRRGDHDLAAQLHPLRRRRRAARDRREMARRPSRLARGPSPPACRERGGAREGPRSTRASRGWSRAAPTRSRASPTRSRTRSGAARRAAPSSRSRTGATSTTPPVSATHRRLASGSPMPEASSASATRGRSCRRSQTPVSTSSPASSATSARPTANGRSASVSATGWS